MTTRNNKLLQFKSSVRSNSNKNKVLSFLRKYQVVGIFQLSDQ